MGSRTLRENMEAPFQNVIGMKNSLLGLLGYDNNRPRRAYNAAGNGMIDLVGADAYNRLMVGNYHIRSLRTPVVFTLATNASITTQRFFVADQNYEISAIQCVFATADGATNTAYISKEISGQAPGAGSTVMTNTFNLNATANTLQTATLNARNNPGYFGTSEPTISVKAGQMLSFKMASAVTSLAGLQITMFVQPQNVLAPAVFNMKLNAAILTQNFYLANRYCTITGIQAVWDHAAASSGTVTLDVTKDTSTNAPGAGSTLLSAAQSVNSATTINAPVSLSLTATTSRLSLNPGDRISIKMTGTTTGLTGLVVVVSFANSTSGVTQSTPTGVVQVQYNLLSNTNLDIATAFFTADRDYEVIDVSGIWSIASTNVFATVTVDTGTTAPGAGTSVLTDNTNTGLDTSTTANTVNIGTLSVSRRVLILPAGARLSVAYTGVTKGSLAGLVVSVSLIPR